MINGEPMVNKAGMMFKLQICRWLLLHELNNSK